MCVCLCGMRRLCVCEVRECVQVPRAVSALCSSPADSTLTLGFIEVCGVCVCVFVCVCVYVCVCVCVCVHPGLHGSFCAC